MFKRRNLRVTRIYQARYTLMCSQSPCLCSLETTPDDWVILSLSQDLPPPPVNNTPASRTPLGMFRHAFVWASNFVLKKDTCCQESGWRDYPSPTNEEHAFTANFIFVQVRKRSWTFKFEIYGKMQSRDFSSNKKNSK